MRFELRDLKASLKKDEGPGEAINELRATCYSSVGNIGCVL